MSLSEELRKRADKKPNKRGHGRRAFFVAREDITQALADNYTAKEIWELLNSQGKMPIQYRTFMIYVNRYIRSKDKEKKGSILSESDHIKTENSTANSDSDKMSAKKESLTQRFEFDAAGKAEDELI